MCTVQWLQGTDVKALAVPLLLLVFLLKVSVIRALGVNFVF